MKAFYSRNSPGILMEELWDPLNDLQKTWNGHSDTQSWNFDMNSSHLEDAVAAFEDINARFNECKLALEQEWMEVNPEGATEELQAANRASPLLQALNRSLHWRRNMYLQLTRVQDLVGTTAHIFRMDNEVCTATHAAFFKARASLASAEEALTESWLDRNPDGTAAELYRACFFSPVVKGLRESLDRKEILYQKVLEQYVSFLSMPDKDRADCIAWNGKELNQTRSMFMEAQDRMYEAESAFSASWVNANPHGTTIELKTACFFHPVITWFRSSFDRKELIHYEFVKQLSCFQNASIAERLLLKEMDQSNVENALKDAMEAQAKLDEADSVHGTLDLCGKVWELLSKHNGNPITEHPKGSLERKEVVLLQRLKQQTFFMVAVPEERAFYLQMDRSSTDSAYMVVRASLDKLTSVETAIAQAWSVNNPDDAIQERQRQCFFHPVARDFRESLTRNEKIYIELVKQQTTFMTMKPNEQETLLGWNMNELTLARNELKVAQEHLRHLEAAFGTDISSSTTHFNPIVKDARESLERKEHMYLEHIIQQTCYRSAKAEDRNRILVWSNTSLKAVQDTLSAEEIKFDNLKTQFMKAWTSINPNLSPDDLRSAMLSQPIIKDMMETVQQFELAQSVALRQQTLYEAMPAVNGNTVEPYGNVIEKSFCVLTACRHKLEDVLAECTRQEKGYTLEQGRTCYFTPQVKLLCESLERADHIYTEILKEQTRYLSIFSSEVVNDKDFNKRLDEVRATVIARIDRVKNTSVTFR
ncbi:hypothetical protein BC830DRAFT_178170 [Chytriomyces sp. MP71]|nr:hypothetical protein BC830DRAFT_178170 [Chytriomyces sp. MP71]